MTHTYLGWGVDQAVIGYWASHPDFDGDPDGDDDRCVFGYSLDEVHAEVRRMIDEDPARCAVPFRPADAFKMTMLHMAGHSK